MAYNPNTNSTDVTNTGTITAADAVVAAPTGNGLPLSGASTAGSIVAIKSNGGASSWIAAITGTLSGTYYFELSNSSTNGTDGTWINVNGRQTGLTGTSTSSNYFTTATGEYRGSPAGSLWFRVRNVGGSGLSTTVTLSMSTGTGPVFLYSSIPSGTNTIGTVLSSNAPLAQVTGAVIAATTTITAGPTSDIVKAGSATVYISGTHAGVNVTFEQSPDGIMWYPTQAQRTDNGVLTTLGATGVLTSNVTVAYDVSPLLGATQLRVRATAWTSGSAAINISPAIRAAEIAPTATLAAGSAAIGSVTVASGTVTTVSTVTAVTTVGTITNGVKVATSPTGGATTFTLISAATTNATVAKASAGTLLSINAYNNGAAVCFLKLYNKATAPTVGTDVAVKTILLPPGGGSNIVAPVAGYNFAAGIAYAITGLPATTDTTAVALNQVVINGAYA